MKIIFKCEGCGLEWATPQEAVKCEEKHKEVTWQEAIIAWVDGKNVRCELDGEVYPYHGERGITMVNTKDDLAVTRAEIRSGKWFIEGGK